ncbi:unnamed protein product [Alopecurus aequalis]
MARAGAAAVLFALVCCLLVGPAPARSPVELPPQVALDATVDREAEPLLPKPLAIVEAADPSTVLSSVEGQAVDLADQAPQIIRCGGEDAAVSEEPLSLGTRAQPAGKGQGEMERDGEKQPDDSDSDTDSDSDDEDNKDGIMGWFWRLARLF